MTGGKKVYRRNKKNGVTYIYLDRPYWDSKTKMSRHEMKCIGKVDPESGEELYNSYCRNTLYETADPMCENRRIGELLILDRLLEGTCLKESLERAFGERRGEELLLLAFHDLCTSEDPSLSEPWFEAQGIEIWKEDLDEILISGGEEGALAAFFYHWNEKMSGEKLNLFSLKTPENLLLLEDGEGVPRYFCTLQSPFSLSHLGTLEAELDEVGITSAFNLVLESVFYSEERLEELRNRNADYVFALPSIDSSCHELIAKHAMVTKFDHVIEEPERGSLFYVWDLEDAKRGTIHICLESEEDEYFVLLSSNALDAEQSLSLFLKRDIAYLHFGRRSSFSGKGSRIGRGQLLLRFLSLIQMSLLSALIEESEDDEVRTLDWREVLAYASSYERITVDGKTYYNAQSEKQMKIFKALGVSLQ